MRDLISFKDFDWLLIVIAVILAIIGAVEIHSATANTPLAVEYKRQIEWIILGVVAALVISQFDYHLLLEQTPWLYVLTILALGAVLVIAPRIGGTRRWFHVAGMTFQVSELAKLIIIMVVAAFLAGRSASETVTWSQLLGIGVLVGLPAALVAFEPDLGTALTFVPIAAAGAFLAGVRWRQVFLIFLLGIALLPLGWHFMRPYQRQRLLTFVHPSESTQSSGYQLEQTKIAVGSGGLWGQGLGHGTQSNLGFLPVSHADAIFAAFAEEQGFAGVVLALALYLILLLRLLDCAQVAPDRAGAFLLAGFASVLFFQIAVNVGMMIGLIPMTGIPLPLMSQGGSSILAVFLGLGLAMSVRKQRFVN